MKQWGQNDNIMKYLKLYWIIYVSKKRRKWLKNEFLPKIPIKYSGHIRENVRGNAYTSQTTLFTLRSPW